MTLPNACPDEAELVLLARGTTAEGRGAFLRDHIGDCQACRVAVAELTSSASESAAPAAREVDPERYELKRLLAMGGMGEVFLARDNVLGRDVAIKLLHEDASSDTSSLEHLARSRRRLLREAQALASFSHPNVVAVYDQGVLDGRAFLAMEYVRGRTLRQWIEEEKPDVLCITDALAQAGRGLLAAHEIGLIHRDFKPDNVLVGDDGRARVTDFGLARLAQRADPDPDAEKVADRASALSATVEGAGTPAYMAPEQFDGKPADARSDQYAFCVTFYEAIHGNRPDMDRTIPQSAPRKRAVRLTEEGRIDAVLARGLKTIASDRFPSMREVLAELDALGSSPTTVRKGRSVAFRAVRGLLIGAVVALAGSLLVVRARHPSTPSALHSPCFAGSGGCPAPLVCHYPAGNWCGVSGAAGVCGWPADDCNAKSTEVCGCDGVTYKNACEAQSRGVGTAARGACVQCTADAPCNDINGAGVRTAAFCHHALASAPRTGVCLARPSACAPGGPPVCGWDGVTYENACEARRSGSEAERDGRCSSDAADALAGRSLAQDANDASVGSGGLKFGAPDEQGMDARPLINLTKWIEAEKLPIFSILVSRNGVLVYELYTSNVTREDAHYLWGATVGVTSALMGVAIDRHLVASPETSVADALPANLFPNDAAVERFRRVTIRDVLAMSALDAPVSSRDKSETTQERLRQFLATPNRIQFALAQALLPEPGKSFQYTDVTPDIAAGIIEYGTKMPALEFAEESLFHPMEFRNYEWMHQDKTGHDSGGYGLRLRPIDMQKLGVLYLQQGVWEKKRLLSSEWALQSFSPWIMASEDHPKPNFGWYWWTTDFGHAASPGSAQAGKAWIAHQVTGWKGQRIAVFADQGVVVTMTGLLEPPEDEFAIFRRVVRDYVMPSVEGPGGAGAHPDPSLRGALGDLLERVQKEAMPVKSSHPDAIPSAKPKGRPHRGFHPK